MTILVESPVDRALHQGVARSLMAYDSVHAEQAGFIEPAASPEAWARLQMMGGEFCGNATMSLAAHLACRKGYPAGSRVEVPLEVSGAEGLLRCQVIVEDGYYLCKVQMPAPQGLERRDLPLDGALYPVTMIYLPGITHILLPVEAVPGDYREFAARAVHKWGDLTGEEAFGLLFYDDRSCRIEPLVYVKPTQTVVWERGCGSGTAAVGVFLAQRARSDIHAHVSQPGGSIAVWANWSEGAVRDIHIQGKVRIVAEGTAFLPDL